MTRTSTGPPGTDASRPTDEPVDLRLVPATAAAWLTALLVVRSPALVTLTLGLLATAVGAACLRWVHRTERDGQWLLVVAAVAVLALTAVPRTLAREAGDLRELAERGSTVGLVGVVRSSPVPVSGQSSRGTVRVVLALTATEVDGTTTGSGAAVDLYLDGDQPGLVYGTTVRTTARLGPAADRTRRAVARATATADIRVLAGPHPVLRVTEGIRAALAEVAAEVPGDAGALLPAISVGDTRSTGDLDEAMRASGLAHVTAVSGAHFSLVGTVVVAAVSRCGVRRRWRWLPVGACGAGFLLLVQPGPAVVRAAVMGAVGVLGVAAGRPGRSVPALAASVLVLLLCDPWLSVDLGFVLSVVATAGIALLAAPLAGRWAPRTGRPAALALAVPVAAQAVCAPVVLLLSPEVPVYAVAANVLVAPAVGPATLLGLLTALLAVLWPAAALVCAHLSGAACWWVAAVARTTVALPGAQLAWVQGGWGVLLLAVASGCALALVLGRRRGVAP